MNHRKFILIILLTSCVFSLDAQNRSFSSNLPLFFINTNGNEIRDEPKIVAELGVVWNKDAASNSTSGDFNHYNGKIRIEIRGSSSQMYPKKSYGFETIDASGKDMDFPLLGLPEEEDWILYAPYSDKTLIRNVLTFTLAASLGDYASRCRFVELFLNNEYQGVYVLMEKIKRDNNRIDVAKLTPKDTTGEDLTGGYIIKIDKQTGSGGGGWYSKFSNEKNTFTFYQYEYPASDEIQDVQAEYIQNYFHDFENAMYKREFDPVTGYQKYINIRSFIDYFIINELAKNIDAYRLSAFFYKDKNDKLNAGPVWDFNLAYGNANYLLAWERNGLQVYADLQDDMWQNPFWWRLLAGDQNFSSNLRCRWDSLHQTVLSTERVIQVADSLVDLLDKPAERNYQRWPVLDEWVWPNYYVGNDYLTEVNWLKNWIYERMRLLHLAIPGHCGNELPNYEKGLTVDLYPNPVSKILSLKITSASNLTLQLQLFNTAGNMIFNEKLQIVSGDQTIPVHVEGVSGGIYIYRILKGDKTEQRGKLIKW